MNKDWILILLSTCYFTLVYVAIGWSLRIYTKKIRSKVIDQIFDIAYVIRKDQISDNTKKAILEDIRANLNAKEGK